MGRWKPSVVYLRGPGFVRSLRSARIRLNATPAQDERDTNRPVRFMWDYGAFPVWIDAAQLNELDASFQRELQDWSDRVTTAMWGPHGPDAPGWDGPDDAVVQALDAEGRALAQRLHDTVGWQVEYEPL
jgi:hypothetical protein